MYSSHLRSCWMPLGPCKMRGCTSLQKNGFGGVSAVSFLEGSAPNSVWAYLESDCHLFVGSIQPDGSTNHYHFATVCSPNKQL